MGIPLQLGTGKVNALYQIKKCFFFQFQTIFQYINWFTLIFVSLTRNMISSREVVQRTVLTLKAG